MSEELLVLHCAPTLAGLKTGSLVTVPYGSQGEMRLALRSLNRRVAPKGMIALPVQYRAGRALVYLYRPRLLERDLARRETARLMRAWGYDSPGVAPCIHRLMARLAEGEGFPHEIGLFLGYPPEDVQGFIRHRADNYKCCGYWKVYGDVEQAQRQFARFRACSACYWAQWCKGASIERLTVAV